mmetsp:Transcript_54368/g.143094  ORF Transcript_54368/g.143094 Transcript_54368/m.143094 type:complete len:83 (+) Transcript_54368:291-539(+)
MMLYGHKLLAVSPLCEGSTSSARKPTSLALQLLLRKLAISCLSLVFSSAKLFECTCTKTNESGGAQTRAQKGGSGQLPCERA